MRHLLVLSVSLVASAVRADDTRDVHLASTDDIVLQRDDPWSGGRWKDVCYGTCTDRLRIDRPFRIVDGDNSSTPFLITSQSNELTVIEVRSPPHTRVAGIVLASLGGTIALAGVPVVALSTFCIFCTSRGPNTATYVGYAMVAGGAASLVAGLVLVALADVWHISGPIHFTAPQMTTTAPERNLLHPIVDTSALPVVSLTF